MVTDAEKGTKIPLTITSSLVPQSLEGSLQLNRVPLTYLSRMSVPTIASLFSAFHPSRAGVSANRPKACSAGHRSPETEAFVTRSRMCRDSAVVSSTCMAATFSSMYSSVIVLLPISLRFFQCPIGGPWTHPGIGKISSPWLNSHAKATCPTVTPFASATSFIAFTISMFLGKFSFENLG